MFSRLLAWFVGEMVRSYVVYKGDGIWLSRVESDDTWLFLVCEILCSCFLWIAIVCC